MNRLDNHQTNRIPKTLFNSFILIILFLTFSSSADARSVKVGVYDNAPIVYQGKDGTFQGLSVDVLEYVAAQEGWDIEFVLGTFAECIERLNNGKIDVQVYIAYSKERALKYDFTHEPLLNNWGTVYTWPGSGIEQILDLEGKKVALMPKSIHPPAFKELVYDFGINIDIIEIDNHSDGFDLVRNKKADAVVVNRVYGLTNAEQFNLEKTHIIFNPIEIRYAMPKGKNADLIEAIDKHLQKLKADKQSLFYKSFNEAFGLETPVELLPKWIFWAAGIGIFAIILLVLFNRVLSRHVEEETKKLKVEISERKKAEEEEKSKHLHDLTERIKELKCLYAISDLLGRKNISLEDTFQGVVDVIPPAWQYPDVTCAQIQVEGQIYKTSNFKRSDLFQVQDIFVNDKSIGAIEVFYNEEMPDNHEGPFLEEEQELLNDICDRVGNKIKRSEDKKKQIDFKAKMQQAQKMESIGTLAGGIAHDFNNILASILGYGEIALDDLPKDSQTAKDIQRVIKAGHRAKNLVKQILAFSRRDEPELVPCKIQLVLKEALNLLRSSIPSTIEIKQNIDPSCALTLADPTQIHQVVMNLCTNAYHAMRETRGELTVSLNSVDLLPEDLNKINLQPGSYLNLTVSDTGLGIDKINLDKIFDPYFTTKEKGDGTGLGLATVHGIVTGFSGDIIVYSEPGKGTVFNIYLPVIDEQEEMFEDKAVTPNPSGTERILIVDDDEELNQMNKTMIESLGYTVTALTSSVVTLDTFQKDPTAYDLLLTDMTMPKMTGAELSIKILAIRPDIPIVMCTGFSDLIDEKQAKEIGIREFIAKPVIKKDLAKTLRSVLDNKNS